MASCGPPPPRAAAATPAAAAIAAARAAATPGAAALHAGASSSIAVPQAQGSTAQSARTREGLTFFSFDLGKIQHCSFSPSFFHTYTSYMHAASG